MSTMSRPPPTRNPELCAGLLTGVLTQVLTQVLTHVLTHVRSPVALRTQTVALDQETRASVQTRTVTAN